MLLPLQLGVKPVSELVPFGHFVSVPTKFSKTILYYMTNNTKEVLK